jgi:hypothetical protein
MRRDVVDITKENKGGGANKLISEKWLKWL